MAAGDIGFGEVVFRRGEHENENDIWDDTALIKAYDNAVSSMKVMLGEKDVQKPAEEKKIKKKHKKSKNKQKTKYFNGNLRQAQWHAGSPCRAIYSEDGQIYEAVIVSVNSDAETCVVRYHGYDNEEEQSLLDLLPTATSQPGHRSASETAPSESESMDGICSGRNSRQQQHQAGRQRPPHPQRTPHDPRSTSHDSIRSNRGGAWLPPPTFNGMHVPPPFMSGMPPIGLMPAFSGWPGMASMSMPAVPLSMPPIPPPPPMPELDSTIDSDKEALYSMLISWYMSGYHTGYYQGLKHRHKDDSTSTNHHSTESKAHH